MCGQNRWLGDGANQRKLEEDKQEKRGYRGTGDNMPKSWSMGYKYDS